MTGGSLFSGIGGFELGLLRSGLITEVKWQVEIDGFCQRVLERHFPDTKRYGDIRELHGAIAHTKSRMSGEQTEQKRREGTCGRSGKSNIETPYCPSCLEPVDVIFGGFPCQPFSVAGKRQGAADDRYLWPEMVRIIAEIRPTLVIGENVSGIVNMALDQVLSDLEAEGYETATFVIPACAVNAPHRRDRVWIVAYSKNMFCNGGNDNAGVSTCGKSFSKSGNSCWNSHAPDAKVTERECAGVARTGRDGFADQDTNAPNSHIQGLQGKPDNAGSEGAKSHDKQFMRCNRGWEENWLEVATRFCGVDDVVPNRVDRLKALGNAVVPQVAEAIGTIIKGWLDDRPVD